MESGGPTDKILELMRRTGERCIVVDDEQSPYVVMTLSEYERLVAQEKEAQETKKGFEGLTSRELLDRINQEIDRWKSLESEGGRFAGPRRDQSEKLKRRGEPAFAATGMAEEPEAETYFTEPLD